MNKFSTRIAILSSAMPKLVPTIEAHPLIVSLDKYKLQTIVI